MINQKILIRNKLGLHARAAVKFVNMANKFQSSIKVCKGSNEIDGKSILGLLTLAATQGSEILLKISGSDEIKMLEALTALINGKFGEDE